MKLLNRIRFVCCVAMLSFAMVSTIGCGGFATTPEQKTDQKESLVNKKVALKRPKTKQYLTTSDGKIVPSGEVSAWTGIVTLEDVKDTEDYVLLNYGPGEYWVKTDDIVTIEKSKEYFQKILDGSPQAYDALIARAGMYQEMNNPEAAIADLTEAIRQRSGIATAVIQRANLFEKTGDYLSARQDYDRLLKIENLTKHMISRARCLQKTGESEKALKELARIIDTDPKQVQAYVDRALIWESKGESKAAELDFDRAIENSTRNSEVYIARGKYWIKKKQHSKALEDFEMALKYSPESPTAMAYASMVLSSGADLEKRNPNRAIELAKKAFEITGGKNSTVLDALALAYAATGNFVDAAKYEKLANEDPLFAKEYSKLTSRKLESFDKQQPYMLD